MRLGLAGGGTDVAPYSDLYGGRVLNATISLFTHCHIDRLSAGRIDVREYTAYEPRFSGYALLAVALWLTAAGLKVGVRGFRTYP